MFGVCRTFLAVNVILLHVFNIPTLGNYSVFSFFILSGFLMKLVVNENYQNILESLNFLETMDVFLGQRLHSIIFSSTIFTPFHALEYEPRTSDFLKTLDLIDYITRVNVLDVNVIFEKINVLYSNMEKEQQLLLYKLITAQAEQKKHINMFLSKV